MNLKRRQELYFDGIEISFGMMRFCYSRLINSIEQYSRVINQTDLAQNYQIQILVDIWSIVDIVNRLRKFISQAPGIKKQSPQVILFHKFTENIEIPRNFIQHLDGEIHNIEDIGLPLWGSVSWLYISPENSAQKIVSSLLMIPGRLAKFDGLPIVNPAGMIIEPPVDHVTLTASKMTIDISDNYRYIMKFESLFSNDLEGLKANDGIRKVENEIVQMLIE